jgi:hypothetical protein
LPGEREVIGVLRERHADGERDRVAPAGRELRRAERRVDAPAAAAAVFLSPMADEAEGALDDVDLVGILGLAVPDEEPAAALRTLLIGGVERVDDLDERLSCASNAGTSAICRPSMRTPLGRTTTRPGVGSAMTVSARIATGRTRSGRVAARTQPVIAPIEEPISRAIVGQPARAACRSRA